MLWFLLPNANFDCLILIFFLIWALDNATGIVTTCYRELVMHKNYNFQTNNCIFPA